MLPWLNFLSFDSKQYMKYGQILFGSFSAHIQRSHCFSRYHFENKMEKVLKLP